MNTSDAVSSIKVDKTIKEQAEIFAANLGTTIPQVVNQFLKNIILTKGRIILRSDVEEAEPTPYLKRVLRNSQKDRNNDSPTFNTGEEAVKWLEEQGI